MTYADRPFSVVVPAHGRWFSRGTRVRCVPASARPPIENIVEDANGDHEVLTCRLLGIRQADLLRVEIRKIR